MTRSSISSLACGAWSMAITRIDEGGGYNVERLVDVTGLPPAASECREPASNGGARD
jgi:hypothetical protein